MTGPTALAVAGADAPASYMPPLQGAAGLAAGAGLALLYLAMICAICGVGARAQAQPAGERGGAGDGAGAATDDLQRESSPITRRPREAATHDVDAEPIFVRCGFVDEIPVCGSAAGGWWTADQAPAPLAAPAPIYPPRLLARGVEGWVVIELTVAEDGSVDNPKVVDAEPRAVFDAATLRAVARYRFPPPLVAVHGVTVRVEFRIPEAGSESARRGRR